MNTLVIKLTARYALIASAITCLILGVIFSLISGWPNGWSGSTWLIFVSVNTAVDAVVAWIIYLVCTALSVICDAIARFVFNLFFGFCYR
jgi:hypothetical protein